MKYLIAFFFLSFHINLNAEHLFGGEISYQHLEATPTTNKFQITYNTYWDCAEPTWNVESALIYIYLGDSIVDYFSLTLDTVFTIDNTNFSCLTIPTNLCINKLLYTTIIELPISNESYFVVMQSCCRSGLVSNIIDPQSVGYSYFVEITATAQQIGNSSPDFADIPPTIFCVNENFEIAVNAIDIDGHQIVYKLCSPYTKEPNVPTFPYLPPPYPSVPFIVPEYSYQNPIGQNTQFGIDPNNGIMTGMPSIEGQFVVGICVEEYYNGQLLSAVIRDIQINVALCIPHAQINIENAIPNLDSTLVLNFCETDEIAIQNTSLDTNFINQFYWVFDNNIDTIFDWNPILNFSESGSYSGQLFLNPGEQCSDTADIIINVNKDLNADFEVTYDTCIGGEVEFLSTSFSEGGEIINWEWNFGDNAQSQIEHPQHLYQTPGAKETKLIITNEYNCKDTVINTFDWLPAPPIIVVAPNTFAGCSPLNVFFENLSSPIDSAYNILWDFGNGDFSTEISPSYIYEDDGIYDIEVSVTSPIGCSIDTFFSNWITVEPKPIANFDWEPKEVTNFSSEVIFTDFSNRAEAWDWKFNEISESFTQQANYIFSDTGIQSITLIVTDQYGCQDSITQWLDVVPKTSYFLPNAFTPNQDSKNEIYLGKGVLEGITDFQMNIWNRWGELVFTSKDPYVGWDGRHTKTGKVVKEGVYICTVKYQTSRGKMFEFKQSLALIK